MTPHETSFSSLFSLPIIQPIAKEASVKTFPGSSISSTIFTTERALPQGVYVTVSRQ